MQDHRRDQTLAASEVMQDSGMRDAHIGGYLLKADRLRPSAHQAALRGLENRSPRIRGAASALSSPSPPDNPQATLSANGVQSTRPREQSPSAERRRLPLRSRPTCRDAADTSEESIGKRDASRASRGFSQAVQATRRPPYREIREV